jgi:emp24/gp25L/p24 family/GOLD
MMRSSALRFHSHRRYRSNSGGSSSSSSRHHSASLWLVLLFVALLFCCIFKESRALFPVVMEIDEDESRCFNFNVGSDADVHLILLPLPHETQIGDGDEDNNQQHDLVESWYVQQVYKMLRQKLDADDRSGRSDSNTPIPSTIVNRLPEAIKKVIAPFQRSAARSKSSSSPIKVTISVVGADGDHPRLQYDTSYGQNTKYFEPLVINNLRRTMADRHRDDRQRQQPNNASFMSVKLCIINQDEEEHVHVIFVKLQDGEDIGDHDAAPMAGEEEQEEAETPEQARARFEKEKHLYPLETSLQRSINAANSVLRDMKFMELREKRLRQTSDNINNRIRYFAYLSVCILLAVTYLQVTYLKSYFHKKKVL